jgi:Family of unknown function (DUF6428)
MKLSEVKKHLAKATQVNFKLPSGALVPEHFHVTEVGVVHKHFIDCGGKVRNEKVANFQLWNADDIDHRLKPEKLVNIITLSEKVLDMEDYDVEVEYQDYTIGKYDLDFDGTHFLLLAKQTDCLAEDKCGILTEKLKVSMAGLQNQSSCKPASGCC